MKREEPIKHQFDRLTAEIYDWEYLTQYFLKRECKS